MQNPLTSSLRFVNNFVVGWTAERQLAWYSHAAALRKAKRRTAYAVVDALRRAAIRVESTSSLPTTRSEFPDAVKLLDRRQVFFFIFYDFLYAFNILRFKVDVVKWA